MSTLPPANRRPLFAAHELYVPVLFEESKIAEEVEVLRAHLELRQADHLSQIALTVAPIQGRGGHAPEATPPASPRAARG